jgi:hypothetical protein
MSLIGFSVWLDRIDESRPESAVGGYLAYARSIWMPRAGPLSRSPSRNATPPAREAAPAGRGVRSAQAIRPLKAGRADSKSTGTLAKRRVSRLQTGGKPAGATHE